MGRDRTELGTLKRLLFETDLILSATDLPENRTARCRELLKSAMILVDDLLKPENLPAAALLGSKGDDHGR